MEAVEVAVVFVSSFEVAEEVEVSACSPVSPFVVVVVVVEAVEVAVVFVSSFEVAEEVEVSACSPVSPFEVVVVVVEAVEVAVVFVSPFEVAVVFVVVLQMYVEVRVLTAVLDGQTCYRTESDVVASVVVVAAFAVASGKATEPLYERSVYSILGPDVAQAKFLLLVVAAVAVAAAALLLSGAPDKNATVPESLRTHSAGHVVAFAFAGFVPENQPATAGVVALVGAAVCAEGADISSVGVFGAVVAGTGEPAFSAAEGSVAG